MENRERNSGDVRAMARGGGDRSKKPGRRHVRVAVAAALLETVLADVLVERAPEASGVAVSDVLVQPSGGPRRLVPNPSGSAPRRAARLRDALVV